MRHTMYTFILLLTFTLTLQATRFGIIGGGFGGSSASYHVKEMIPDAEIEIFDNRSYFGGRSYRTVFENYDVELGASIYHKANWLFRDLSIKFGLKNRSLSDLVGIWDGKEMVFYESEYNVLTLLKGLWRWWINPILVDRMVVSVFLMVGIAEGVREQWKAVYADDVPWETVDEFIDRFKFKELTVKTMKEFLTERSISARYIDEMVAGMCRVTYNQDADELSAMGGLISVVGSGADLYALEEGNYKLAEALVSDSNAVQHRNTVVTEVIRSDAKPYTYTVKTNTGKSYEFDQIILAAPLESCDIKFNFELPEGSCCRSYQTVHVTLVQGVLNDKYFGTDGVTYSDVLTTNHASSPFTSIGKKGVKDNVTATDRVFKFFSRDVLSDEEINNLFTSHSKTERFIWQAYPKLTKDILHPPMKLDDNIYYINAFESVFSVMEAEIVQGRNIARLIKNTLLPEAQKEANKVNEDL